MEILIALSILVFFTSASSALANMLRSKPDQTSLRLNFFLVKLEREKFSESGTIVQMVNYCLSVSNFVPGLDFTANKLIYIQWLNPGIALA